MDNRFKKDITLLTVDDIRDILDVGRTKAYELVNEGKIRAFKVGNKWKITQEAVDEYIMKNVGLI